MLRHMSLEAVTLLNLPLAELRAELGCADAPEGTILTTDGEQLRARARGDASEIYLGVSLADAAPEDLAMALTMTLGAAVRHAEGRGLLVYPAKLATSVPVDGYAARVAELAELGDWIVPLPPSALGEAMQELGGAPLEAMMGQLAGQLGAMLPPELAAQMNGPGGPGMGGLLEQAMAGAQAILSDPAKAREMMDALGGAAGARDLLGRCRRGCRVLPRRRPHRRPQGRPRQDCPAGSTWAGSTSEP